MLSPTQQRKAENRAFIEDTLNSLPLTDETKALALSNFRNTSCGFVPTADGGIDIDFSETVKHIKDNPLCSCLSVCFMWRRTPEGFAFWDSIDSSLHGHNA